jgi:NADH:ubiquinone oxidoreductase subunit F (NADH-binding)
MVDAAKYFLDFEEGLSCGKCVPCRIGMKRMLESLERIVSGQGAEQDLEQIRALCQTMKKTPHCDFALASSRPVLSAMMYFEDEFKAHIERKECPAGVCKDLVELQRKKQVRERLKKTK